MDLLEKSILQKSKNLQKSKKNDGQSKQETVRRILGRTRKRKTK